MTLTRRLLMAAGGTGTFTQPPSLWALTAADDGGWTHANAPSAVEYGGIVFFGYVDMASGNVEVRSFDPDTGTTSSAFVLHSALEADTHAAPSLYVRSDGRLLAVYSSHTDTTMRRRVTTNVLPDITAWDVEGSLDASLGGTEYTYPTIVGYGSDIWLFYRDWQGAGPGTAVLCYSVSGDDGATWSAQTEVYKSADRQSYWMVDSTGSRIDVVASDGRTPPNTGDVTIGHVYYDGTWRKSDGTSAGALPLDPTDLTEVYDSADGMGWPMDIVAGTNPVFTYAVLNAPTSNSWRWARWTGSAWVNSTIDESDGDIDTGFASSICLDHLDPTRAYAPVKVGGYWQMHRYWTTDGGSSWAILAITTGTDDHLTPKAVYSSTGSVRALWMTGGPYTGFLDPGFGITAGR